MKTIKKILASMLAISMVASFASINVSADAEYVSIAGGTWDFEGITTIPSGITTENTGDGTVTGLVHSETVTGGSLKLMAYSKTGVTSSNYGVYWEGATFTAPTPTNTAATVKCEIDTSYAYANHSTKVVVTMNDNTAYTFGWPTWTASYVNNNAYNVDYTVTFNPAEGVLAFDAVGTNSDGTAFSGRTKSATETGVTAASIKNVYIGYTYFNNENTALSINDVSFKEEVVPEELGGGTVLYEQNFDDVSTYTEAGMGYQGNQAATASVIAKPNGATGDKVLSLTRTSTGKWTGYTVTTSSLGDSGKGIYLVEYDVYTPGYALAGFNLSTAYSSVYPCYHQYNALSGTQGKVSVQTQGQANKLPNTDGETFSNYTTNEWTKMAYVVDTESLTFQTYINGTLNKTTSMTEADASRGNIKHFIFGLGFAAAANGVHYFDNIKITKLSDTDLCTLFMTVTSSEAATSGMLKNATVYDTAAEVVGASDKYLAVTTLNADDAAKTAKYIVATYDGGKLVGVMSTDFATAAGTADTVTYTASGATEATTKNVINPKTLTQTIGISTIVTSDVDEIKLFAWDGYTSILPVATSVTLSN